MALRSTLGGNAGSRHRPPRSLGTARSASSQTPQARQFPAIRPFRPPRLHPRLHPHRARPPALAFLPRNPTSRPPRHALGSAWPRRLRWSAKPRWWDRRSPWVGRRPDRESSPVRVSLPARSPRPTTRPSTTRSDAMRTGKTPLPAEFDVPLRPTCPSPPDLGDHPPRCLGGLRTLPGEDPRPTDTSLRKSSWTKPDIISAGSASRPSRPVTNSVVAAAPKSRRTSCRLAPCSSATCRTHPKPGWS